MRAIVAVNNLGFIGRGDELIWHNKEDLKHFKEMTLGGRCLVGYNTNKGLPTLKGRDVIVDQRDVFDITCDWCIGGKKTYEKYVKQFTEIHISHINDNQIGDVTFPDLTGLSSDCKIINYYFGY
jgi:dihydrofolate reductase